MVAIDNRTIVGKDPAGKTSQCSYSGLTSRKTKANAKFATEWQMNERAEASNEFLQHK